jgi:hypothetical protein
MTNPTHTARITRQVHTLVRAIEALVVIEPLTLLERIAAQLLQAWYRRRLQYLVAAVPRWAGERILSSSEAIRATGTRMPAARFIGGRC